MQKRMIWWTVPAAGLLAFFAVRTGELPGAALGAGGASGTGGGSGSVATGSTGGGTKVYANGGYDVNIYVDEINDTLSASGALGTTRSEPFAPAVSQTKEIGCWIDGSSTGAIVTCQAIMNNGTALRCSAAMSPTPNKTYPQPWGNGFAQALGALNGDSYIIFQTDLSSTDQGLGNCLGISIDNNSKYFPRVP